MLNQCPATAEVLEEIVKAVDGSMKVFVDGGSVLEQMCGAHSLAEITRDMVR